MIVTYPTGKTVEYMGHTIQVPHWVKYIALLPRQYKSANTSLIGFSKKPKLTKKQYLGILWETRRNWFL